MPKNTGIQMQWVDVSSAVEIALSNMVAKKEISIIEKNCQTLQILSGIIFEKLP